MVWGSGCVVRCRHAAFGQCESCEKRPKEEEVGCDFYLVEKSRRYLSLALACVCMCMCVCVNSLYWFEISSMLLLCKGTRIYLHYMGKVKRAVDQDVREHKRISTRLRMQKLSDH